MSKPTLLEYLEEIGHLGVCSFHKGSFDEGSYLSLDEEFPFLLLGYGKEERTEDVPF